MRYLAEIAETIRAYRVETERQAKTAARADGIARALRDLGDVERKKMALAIEPWVNQKAGEYEALGFPGKKTFLRLIAVAKEKGATPVHEYNIK